MTPVTTVFIELAFGCVVVALHMVGYRQATRSMVVCSYITSEGTTLVAFSLR